MMKGVMSEEDLLLTEDAGRACGFNVFRYAVRDTTMIHRLLNASGQSIVWNPLDPCTLDHFHILVHVQSDMTMRLTKSNGKTSIQFNFDHGAGGHATGNPLEAWLFCRALTTAAAHYHRSTFSKEVYEDL